MNNKALKYDPTNKESILAYSKRLIGSSLRMSCNKEILSHNYSGKGTFGQILEKYYFQYQPNSLSEPDFPIAGIELKSTPLKKTTNGEFRAKERLVLNIINYFDIIEQDFKDSSFFKKNAHLLLICYLHDNYKTPIDFLIKLVDEWRFPDTDLEIIKRDWETIRSKVEAGRAHELSEGDTFYLGACTKGKNASSKRKQPYSAELAMQRAFSFKSSYVNHIIANIAGQEKGYGKLIPSLEVAKKETIEDAIINKFKKFYDHTVEEIQDELGLELNRGAKNFYANLTRAIEGYEEIDKAGIIVRTVRLKENGMPAEDISFPTFKYVDIVNKEWGVSSFKDMLERKFLFVFFQHEGKNIVLRKVKFWNMPYNDILEAKKVWESTKEKVQDGEIIKTIKNNIRYTHFPDKSDNRVAHVRPHAKNKDDTYPLPIPDRLSGVGQYTKHCFWLNNTYVRDEIYKK